MAKIINRKLVFEDGTEYYGTAFGGSEDRVCEIVFNTSMELVERTGVHSGDSISVYPTFSLSQKVKDTILDYTRRLGLGIGIVGLYNIQFIVDKKEDVYIIEVNPRSSRTVPFLSKSTGYNLADIGTLVILGKSLQEQGFTELYPPEKKRWYVKAPAFSFSKLRGLDAYLSPEMKSTGEAIGYDDKMTRALYKALQASGMNVVNYGTIFVTIADADKEEALPLIRRFYDMKKGLERLAQARIENHSLTNFDTVAKVAAEKGYIRPEDVRRLLKFRDDPADESWTDIGKEAQK